MKIFNIAEIFYSLQGEGYWSGTPAVFIRLAGCNLACPWCDTPAPKEVLKMSPATIIEQVEELLSKSGKNRSSVLLVITGGEPTIQDYYQLVTSLKAAFPHNPLSMETNGRVCHEYDFYFLRKAFGMWATVSPKFGIDKNIESYFGDGRWRGDELKVVFDTKEDLRILAQLPDILGERFGHYYIQPLSCDYEAAINFVKGNQKWKLSIQAQKILKVK